MKQKSNLIIICLCLSLGYCMLSCVQATKKQTVHFEVDARQEADLSSISVRGSLAPLNWNDNFELSDEDQDSIYTGSITFDIPYDYVNIKFVKNAEQFELDNQDNRKLVFDKSQTTTYQAIFNQPN